MTKTVKIYTDTQRHNQQPHGYSSAIPGKNPQPHLKEVAHPLLPINKDKVISRG